LNKNKP